MVVNGERIIMIGAIVDIVLGIGLVCATSATWHLMSRVEHLERKGR